ncbi:MAG: ABC transporter ATP-binding protein [Patescibacteria group bacterium]
MKNIVKILRLAKPLYGLIAISGSLIVLVSITSFATPFFTKLITDEIVAQITEGTGDIQRLILLIIAAFITGVLFVILTAISNRFGDKLAARLRKYLTQQFYHKALSLPQSYYDSQISGKIVNQLNRGIQVIIDFLGAATNFILPNILQIIITISILLYYNLPVGIFMAILFPIYTSITMKSGKKWGEHEVKKNRFEDIIRGRMNEVIANIKLVKTFITEKYEFDFISRKLGRVVSIHDTQSIQYHRYDFYRNLSLRVILLIVDLFIFYNTFQGNLTIGEMIFIIQLITMARAPLFAMSFIIERVQQAEQGSKEYFEVLDLPSKETFESSNTYKRLSQPALEFADVSFHYDESDSVLRNISFTAQAGETVALVGHSGAGKSTIVNLILKFYDYTSGDIKLNGSSYTDLHHQFIRNNISLVFQDNELFSSTIRENVAYGTKAEDNEVIQALKTANAWEFVEKLPKGIHSEIGERGVRLSGGQKQRIQIARAVLKDAPILILDEATSSLDAKSEKEVQDALEVLFKNRLVLIIAHRFSTIQNANKILVIDSGTIADAGTPHELARKRGIYADLLQYQIEGNEKLLKQYDLF